MKSFQMFIDYSPNPILILNMDGQIAAFNHHVQIWLNVKVNEYISNIVVQLKHKDILEQMFRILQQSNEYHQRLVLDLSIAVKFRVGYAVGNQQSNFVVLYQTAEERLCEDKYLNFKNK